MTTQSGEVRHSDLLNQLVINRSTMEELGRVEVLWMYPPAHRVLGFVCKAGFLGAKKLAFNLTQIHTLGTSSILVHSAPQETDAEKVSQLESLIHCEVWSDSGKKVGKITDYLFDPKTGTISQYLFVSSDWSVVTEGISQLPPSKILSLGRRRVLVAESALRSLSTYREGIKQRLSRVTDSLKEDYTHVTQELRSITQRAQETAEQAKERARRLAEQARERAQALNEQIIEEAQSLAHQAQETGHTLVEQVKERTQTIGEQVKEQADILRDQLDEPANDTTGSDEIPDSIFEDDWDIESPPSTPTQLRVDYPPGETESVSAVPSPVSSDVTLPAPAIDVAAVVTEVIASVPESDDEWDDEWDGEPAAQPIPATQTDASSKPDDEWDEEPSTETIPATQTDFSSKPDDEWDEEWDEEPSAQTIPAIQDPPIQTDAPSKPAAADDDDEPWV